MRVTHQSIASGVLSGLQGNLNRLGETQNRLSTGKQVSKPSDNPAGTVSSMQLRNDLATTRQYTRNADDGLGWLGQADNALQSTSSQVNRVRELVLQGMSSGTAGSPEAREALAAEVANIKDSLVQTANTKYLDRPVFGGTTGKTIAFNPDGSYAGDQGQVQRTVGPNTKVRVDVKADDVFGTGNTQIFKVLDDITNSLKNNPSDLAENLGRFDTAAKRIQSGLSVVGARYNQVDRMRQTADDSELNLTTQLSNVEDIDLPKTITELQLQQTAYQAALAAGAKVVQPSLVDFLR